MGESKLGERGKMRCESVVVGYIPSTVRNELRLGTARNVTP
jgi:hypothetical protein